MGRNKIKIEKIENSKIRQVTFYKRKRGLLKKAMELSLLCESKIFLCIVDKVEKLTIYSSECDINKFLGTYIQKLNQSKIQKDILSNNDYKTLFINANNNSDDYSKLPEDNLIYTVENEHNNVEDKEQKLIHQNVMEYEDNNLNNNDEKLFGFNSDQYEPFNQNNEKDNEISMFLSNTLFDDDNENRYKNTFKIKKEEDDQFQSQAGSKNMNQIFSTIFSTDNNSVSSHNNNNLQCFKSQKNVNQINNNLDKKNIQTNNKSMKNNTLNTKRIREESNNTKGGVVNTMVMAKGTNNSNNFNVIDNLPLNNTNLNHNINLAVINPQNLAHLQNLFPNLNMLSQNIGVVNWVLPVNNVSNEEN